MSFPPHSLDSNVAFNGHYELMLKLMLLKYFSPVKSFGWLVQLSVSFWPRRVKVVAVAVVVVVTVVTTGISPRFRTFQRIIFCLIWIVRKRSATRCLLSTQIIQSEEFTGKWHEDEPLTPPPPSPPLPPMFTDVSVNATADYGFLYILRRFFYPPPTSSSPSSSRPPSE